MFGTALVASLLASTAFADSADLKKNLEELRIAGAKLKVASLMIKGGKTYEIYCLPCHAPNSPLQPFSQSPIVQGAGSELAKFVLFSKTDRSHPAWHLMLSPNDVAELSTYIQFTFRHTDSEIVTPEAVVSVIAEKYGANTACEKAK